MNSHNKQQVCALYSRVSTLLGQDPENQLVHLRRAASDRQYTVLKEFIDKGISGKRERRPALDVLVDDARKKKFTVIFISALDRISRDTRHLLNLIHELDKYGVSIISLREGIDFSSPVGRACLAIIGAISSLERDILADRVKNALAAKKLAAAASGSDWRCGRPVAMTKEVQTEILQLRAKGLSIRQIEKALEKKVSHTSIGRYLKECNTKVDADE